MTAHQESLLEDYIQQLITKEALISQFGLGLREVEFVKEEIYKAIDEEKEEHLERAIHLLWLSEDIEAHIDELNALLLVPHHYSHQVITKTIQDLKNPKSIPFIKKALESNFDYLDYTGSDSDAIAKWFSWALFSIGTKEAIELIEEYTQSTDEGIRNEMIYRLKKINKAI